MSTEAPFKYVEDPQKYCKLVNDLIINADKKWQSVWISAILELFQGSEYSINSVNTLLKMIEKAFKERRYHVRAQAFECWQFFIKEVEKQSACEKLLNVILIPLSASNHSVKSVLDAKLKAWLTLLQTSTLCKSLVRERGIPSLLKILYGPHTLPIASSFEDLFELCGTIYRLMVQKCLKNDENNVILSYLEKAVPILNVNQDTQHLGKEIWINVIEHMSSKKWPIIQFSYLLKTLENLLSTNSKQDKLFTRELLPVLICDYNSYPVEHIIPQLSLLTRCLFYSASSEFNLSTTLEYLIKKFRKKEQILFNELNKTLTEFSEDYKDQLQRCWTTVVSSFCKWNKNEVDTDNYVWILLFPVKYLHEKWNSIIQENMQTCFENICSCSKTDTFIENITRKLNAFLNNSENVPLSLLSAATCLCKVVLQKSKPSDDISAIKDSLITIYEKLLSHTTVEDAQNTLICKYLSCVLYFIERYPEYDQEFRPILSKYKECIDIDWNPKEYPVVQLISKHMNCRSKEDEKLNNVGNKIFSSITPNKPIKSTNQSFLTKLSPAENKILDGSPFSKRPISVTKLQNDSTPKTQKSKSKDDHIEFVAIKPAPKNSPMTEHQREIAKEKSYIPALYEDLSQSQSHTDSQSMLPNENTLPPVKLSSVEIIEENAILPCSDTNGDSADEIPASLNFREAILKDKSSTSFASRKSLFSEPASDSPSVCTTKTIPPKRKSMRIEKKITHTSTKRARLSLQTPIPTTDNNSHTTAESCPPLTQSKNITTKINGRRKSVAVEESESSRNVVTSTATESESQNLFVSTTVSKTSSVPASLPPPPPPSPLVNEKNRVPRRKSLKSKNSNVTTSRSPINTRKRKSLSASDASDSTLKKISPFEIDDSCSETDEYSVKKEKCDKSEKELNHTDNSENSSASSSAVTVIAANASTSDLNDSVVIVEEDAEARVIVIDSESQLPRSEEPIVNPTADESKVVEENPATGGVKVTEEDSTMVESTQVLGAFKEDRSKTTEEVLGAFKEDRSKTTEDCNHLRSITDEGRCEDTDDHDQLKNTDEQERSVCESIKSTQSSFNLALSESLKTNDEVHDQQAEVDTSVEENIKIPQCEEQPESMEDETIPKGKAEDDIVSAEKEHSDEGPPSGATDNVPPAPEDVNASASPLSGNPRTLQMLQMVYSGTPNLARTQTRFRSSTRNPNVTTSPANSRPSTNGIDSPRTVTNSRYLKILQVNSHVESSVKPSPCKTVSLPEKMEKFKYTPKECTSPSILKKPNVNGTTSPKSPKSVYFAEVLTDTREYIVHQSSDNWSSGGSQSDNLLSDDEATSQETLYPCLHNCSDDIRNITERLSLNEQQLNTLKRMGIETVGQLASANTMIGKSIPVGDNRIQRLRNALQAYDNDRKLKGLRAPSVRRKITYKSPVEVASIIEILDDEFEPETENRVETETIKDTAIEKPVTTLKLSTPTITLPKLPDTEALVCQSEKLPNNASSPMGETQHCSPSKILLQTSLTNDSVCPPSPATQEIAPSSPDQINECAETAQEIAPSPPVQIKKCAETTPSSPNKLDHLLSSNKSTDSPPKLDDNSQGSPCKTSSLTWSTVDIVDQTQSSSPATEDKRVQDPPDKMDIEFTSTQIIEPASDGEAVEGASEKNKNIDNDVETITDGKLEKGQNECAHTVEELTNGIFDECTQDDEQDFVCTNNEETVFTNRERRTYSKSMTARASIALLRMPQDVDNIVETATTKSLSPEIITVEAVVSQIPASLDESREDRTEETVLTEEQQSISIFSSDVAKNLEDVDDTNNTSSTLVTITAPVSSETRMVDNEAFTTLSSSSKIELVCLDEEPEKVSPDTECVFYALLQRILGPYVGPSCLSKWSNESASRTEIYDIIRSLDEGMECLQSAGLIDTETKNFMRKLKYFKGSE